MSDIERKKIDIPEICRVEGHSAVTVDIKDGEVVDVQLQVFEGTRFFERLVVGHKFDEMPHITSRVCAICSTGHVLAAIFAIEKILGFTAGQNTMLCRELMHLGMIIESHATHICALALPDYLKTPDLLDFASKHKAEFDIWTKLRNLGASIQTVIGGRPFHPVNLHVGGLSHYPRKTELEPLLDKLAECEELAARLCDLLLSLKLPIDKTAEPLYAALIPNGAGYGFFGDCIQTSDGWQASVEDYKRYLGEAVVSYSHAKRSKLNGKPFMVGAMARLSFFSSRLGRQALSIFNASPLKSGDTCTLWNNLAQAIEIVEAITQARTIIARLMELDTNEQLPDLQAARGRAVGAVECPRGTLYHYYELDEKGQILAADMVTPSAQNSARIELDIRAVVSEHVDTDPVELQSHLETLVRAYDPCNTCATHMVSIRW